MSHNNLGGLTTDAPARRTAGLLLAGVSATSFALTGPLGKGLLDAGWSPGAVVTVRLLGSVVALIVPALFALHGRWGLLRRNVGLVTGYGLVAVAAGQLCFLNAIAEMPVGLALLIGYTAPVAVIVWMWFRHSHVPGRLTLLGGLVALGGLVLLLDLGSGTSITATGLLWSLGAMTGLAVYFVLSANEDSGLPPMVLAVGGHLVGGTVIGLAGLAGLVSFAATTTTVYLGGASIPWWFLLIGLATVTGALAFSTGIAASRRLGARVASIVAIVELLIAVLLAWLLLGQLLQPIQLAGGALVLVGVMIVQDR